VGNWRGPALEKKKLKVPANGLEMRERFTEVNSHNVGCRPDIGPGRYGPRPTYMSNGAVDSYGSTGLGPPTTKKSKEREGFQVTHTSGLLRRSQKLETNSGG